MKLRHLYRSRRLTTLSVLALFVLLLGGCLEKRLVWSPDGTRAAVIGDDGLYLTDANGRLSARLAPAVVLVGWLPDSRHLAIVQEREIKDWATLAPVLGEASARIEASAAALWQKLEAGESWGVAILDTGLRPLGTKRGADAVKLCLRDRHAAALKTKLTDDDWQVLASLSVPVHEIRVATLDGEQVVLAPERATVVADVADLRPSRDGSALAWTVESLSAKDTFTLYVTATVGDTRPTLVADCTAAFPDWHADGRSLCYIEHPLQNGATLDDAVVLGTVTRRAILDDAGKVAVAETPEYLAGVLFSPLMHVRCLRDGRVLFDAVEMSLPVSAADYGGDRREQLFVLDPARQSTLSRLVPNRSASKVPPVLAFFEVSPDDTRIVIGGIEGEISVLTLATGEAEEIQGRQQSNRNVTAPVWRTATEFSYFRQGGADRKKKVADGLVLREGEKERLLSDTWPHNVPAGAK